MCITAEIKAYQSRGGEWKEGAPVPSQVAAKLEADKVHEMQGATGRRRCYFNAPHLHPLNARHLYLLNAPLQHPF